MSSEIKKIGAVLGGAFGIALITVGTTLAIQKIQHPVAPPAPEPPAPVVPQVPMAQVISVKPHYVSISIPHKRCHQEPHVVYQQTHSRHPGIGAAVGGVAGALVGQTVGSGD